ncbi:MAG: S-methyl-5-thioribose-1-phosphate isomerase [Bdellovibrionota bacterium]
MKDMISLGLKHVDEKLWVLDQQLLPDREVWLECNHPNEMISYIKSLKVRGAPLIGVAAALSLAKFAETGASSTQIIEAAIALRNARPTAVNLMAAIDRMVPSRESKVDPARLFGLAEEIFDEDVELCKRIGTHGASLVEDGDGILTHCNAGGLATAGIGTAVGVIRKAFEQGKRIHVYVDETRPLLQGGRLTAWELEKLEIPYTLICDNMAATVMRSGKVQRIFVGADRIAANGDFANKIGTYGVAVSAKHHGIPFYPAAPYTTVDLNCASGAGIPIEDRASDEVRGAVGSFGLVRWAPAESQTFNPAFDVTPRELVTALVLDCGVYSRAQLEQGALNS